MGWPRSDRAVCREPATLILARPPPTVLQASLDDDAATGGGGQVHLTHVLTAGGNHQRTEDRQIHQAGTRALLDRLGWRESEQSCVRGAHSQGERRRRPGCSAREAIHEALDRARGSLGFLHLALRLLRQRALRERAPYPDLEGRRFWIDRAGKKTFIAA